MKILYFHQHFKTPATGGGTRSYEFAKRLMANGHDVTMVCGSYMNFNLPPTGKKNIYRGIVDGIDVIQIDLPYANKDSIGNFYAIDSRHSRNFHEVVWQEKKKICFRSARSMARTAKSIGHEKSILIMGYERIGEAEL